MALQPIVQQHHFGGGIHPVASRTATNTACAPVNSPAIHKAKRFTTVHSHLRWSRSRCSSLISASSESVSCLGSSFICLFRVAEWSSARRRRRQRPRRASCRRVVGEVRSCSKPACEDTNSRRQRAQHILCVRKVGDIRSDPCACLCGRHCPECG